MIEITGSFTEIFWQSGDQPYFQITSFFWGGGTYSNLLQSQYTRLCMKNYNRSLNNKVSNKPGTDGLNIRPCNQTVTAPLIPRLSFISHSQMSHRHLSYPASLSNFMCLKKGVEVTVFLLISAWVQKARKQFNPRLSSLFLSLRYPFSLCCQSTNPQPVLLPNFGYSGNWLFRLTLQGPRKPFLLSISLPPTNTKKFKLYNSSTP